VVPGEDDTTNRSYQRRVLRVLDRRRVDGAADHVDDLVEEHTVVDVAAWERYLAAYDEHVPRLYRVAMLLLRGDRHDAEDAVQEVFLAAFGPWRDGTVDDLGAYLRRSLANRVTSRGRHLTVVDRFVSSRRADGRGSRDVDDEATDHVALQRALDSLPTRQRAAVVLRYYEGLSIAETASVLGVTDGTVKSQVSDALHRLRDVLGTGA
jgi:RNA polymerase sigma factor (sigma-70 family)